MPALLPGPGPGSRRTLDLGCGEGRINRSLRSAALPFRDEASGLVVAYMCLPDIGQMPAAMAEAARTCTCGR